MILPNAKGKNEANILDLHVLQFMRQVDQIDVMRMFGNVHTHKSSTGSWKQLQLRNRKRKQRIL
jgi:hypothetical protein